MPGTVYLLHFSEPYRHARHYLGWTAGELEERIRLHMTGQGARLVEVVINAGLELQLARTWQGSRKLERSKKRAGGLGQYCPICRAAGIGQRRRRARQAPEL